MAKIIKWEKIEIPKEYCTMFDLYKGIRNEIEIRKKEYNIRLEWNPATNSNQIIFNHQLLTQSMDFIIIKDIEEGKQFVKEYNEEAEREERII